MNLCTKSIVSFALFVSPILFASTAAAGPCQDLRAQYNRQIKKLDKDYRCQQRQLREEYECNRDRLKKQRRHILKHAPCHRQEQVRVIHQQLRHIADEYDCAEDELEKGYHCSRQQLVQQREIARRECRQAKLHSHAAIPIHSYEVLRPVAPAKIHSHPRQAPPEPQPPVFHRSGHPRHRKTVDFHVSWQGIVFGILANHR